jgi:hypothetical protein
MYDRGLFEQSPYEFTRPRPDQNNRFLSHLFSHRCAHLCPHLLSFDILPQNTGGRGSTYSSQIFRDGSSGLLTFDFELSTPLSFHSLADFMRFHTTPKPFLFRQLRTLHHQRTGGTPISRLPPTLPKSGATGHETRGHDSPFLATRHQPLATSPTIARWKR